MTKNIVLTTSREPTDRLRTFCNDIAHSIPNITRVNRGKLSLDGIAEKALELNADRVVVVDRSKDGVASIRLFRIGISGLTLFPPRINIAGIRLRREFEARIKHTKSLAGAVASENSSAAKKLAQALGEFFDLPVSMDQDKVSNFSAAISISSTAIRRFRITFVLLQSLTEIGPCMDVSKVVWDELE